MNLKRAIATSLVILYQFTSSSIALTASADSGIDAGESTYNAVESSVYYLTDSIVNQSELSNNQYRESKEAESSIEYIYAANADNLSDDAITALSKIILCISEYALNSDVKNVDDMAHFLSVDSLINETTINKLKSCQNLDGGFGLAEGYTSDIIDTKLALKALTDIAESEAMTNAALYIASQQNEDGGFGYQQGLSSNAYLTADIANILVGTIDVNPVLSYYLEDTFTALDSYLDTTFPAINELSASDLDTVYQHFFTALYRLKRDGRYDVSPYYGLQAEDGGVFNDPMATALYLELLVREQNALVAKIDNIAITNDKGYAVSAFNSNENVNISVINEFETDKAHFEMSIVKPDGTAIPLDGNTAVWNTAENPDGEYTVRAEIIRNSNNEVAKSLEQTFRIQHRLAVDSITLALSQPYSRVGDTDSVDITAEFDISNYTEDNQLAINWTVTDVSGSVLSEETVSISEADVAMNSILLGSFTPDTSERNAYIIRAELMSGEMQIAQTTTNYFVSDKSVAIAYATDKDYLTEIDDNAEVTLSLRDERVVDLIFTTSSEDTELIDKYAAKIETIKAKLESMGYAVNLSNVSTSFLSAKDDHEWIEYDHPNYDTQEKDPVTHEKYTKHIVSDKTNIQMLGYTAVPYKDFLFVPDENNSQKIFTFDIQRDQTDWHSMNGGGFLFNTTIDNETNIISGYYILIMRDGLRLYELDAVNLDTFRNNGYAGKEISKFQFNDVYAEHHIKIIANSDTVSLWDGDDIVIDNAELPNIHGNGYGPITSHASHGCSQRSYFTFANITMQTIKGEKLLNVLDNYNFESDNSRYVISLSDTAIEDLDDEEVLNDVAQKIVDKNITFIGLGDENSSEQYQQIVQLIPDNARFYEYSDKTAINTIKNNIIDTEEAKRIPDSDAVVATNLTITGELPDGSSFVQQYDELHEGETISFVVPVDLNNLTSGVDAILLKNIRLDYTDENNNARIKTLDKITLPVIGSDGKITNQVSTDKATYYEHENVSIFDRIHNNSDIRAAKGLTNVISIIDSEGNVIKEFSKPLSEIMTKSYVEVSEIWNVADQSEGQYTINSNVYDGEVLVAESQAVIEVVHHELPQYELIGHLNTSGKLFKADETVGISRYIENIGRYDIENGTITIKIIDTAHEKVVYEREEAINLSIGENNTDSFSVVPANDFTSRGGKEYLITYEVTTEDGQTIELPGDGFMLDGFDFTFMGDDVLFSMNDDASIKGIQMNGWLMNVYGSMHSNSNIEANCSVITVNGDCSSVAGSQFNTWQTLLENDPVAAEFIEFPDVLSVIKSRLQETVLSIENGWTSENDNEFRIYGNNVTAKSDIFSTKDLVIDPSNCFATDADEGVIICSEGDITIRSTDVDIKGIIYAPNGTVRIESNNFNIHGRIIAKNIIFQGSVFTGETFDGDLNLFN
jgi:hypothetical protein